MPSKDRAVEHELIRIAKLAGAVLREHFGKLTSEDISIKGGKIRDLVTIADKASEELILTELEKSFPGVGVLAEESGEHKAGTARFVIDPLDGTTNFAQRLQHFGVSIAFEEESGLSAGVVYIPILDECFSATKGAGAFLNGERIQVSQRSNIQEAFLATGFACVRAGFETNNIPNFTTALTTARAIRRLGAATVDLCYTACGIFDGYFELALSPWDVLAGALIVMEAGGMVSDMDGNDQWKSGKSILATNGLLHKELIELLPVHWPE